MNTVFNQDLFEGIDKGADNSVDLIIAAPHGKNDVGFELNPDYCEIAEKRLQQPENISEPEPQR